MIDYNSVTIVNNISELYDITIGIYHRTQIIIYNNYNNMLALNGTTNSLITIK